MNRAMNFLQALRAPTLQRRSVGAVLAAFLLVWIVLVAYQFHKYHRFLEEDQPYQKFGNAVLLSVDDIPDAAQAAAALRASARWINIRRKEIGRLPGEIQFELRDKQGRLVYGFIDADHGPHLSYQGTGKHWTLRSVEPMRTAQRFITYNTPFIGEYLLLAMPFVLIPVWLSVRTGLKPLQRFAQGIASRHPDDLRPLAEQPKHQELKPLASALDGMLDRLRHRFDRERLFVQDAAHEIRTPLAVVTTQAHVMAHAESAEERVRAYGLLNQAIARASHLAQQLLMLATLDDSQRPPARHIDVAQAAREILAQAVPQAMARRIELSLEAPDHLLIAIDEPAFTSILLNLVDNAIRYGREGGNVVVSLRGDEERIHLQVQDDGPGIPESEQALVFERFYRGAGQEVSGSGLGLAIVKQAALRMGGRALVTAGLARQGVGFLVSLPVPGFVAR
ncbi:HAMP domain-containing protein [Caenimonas sedimenti]|uniref:histidine kinase n=1 Tax=Caenimonas sedimenti TaxID=2596921 RepID=A0A562ZQ27_9BURK|nr:ATP-binding protein [Caenimonas sedimenti]TWO70690.1 HAMP domain-containing protein [Caenimonas sedimenti]